MGPSVGVDVDVEYGKTESVERFSVTYFLTFAIYYGNIQKVEKKLPFINPATHTFGVKLIKLLSMYSFGYFPAVRLWFADVSEPSISSIFKGWM